METILFFFREIQELPEPLERLDSKGTMEVRAVQEWRAHQELPAQRVQQALTVAQ
jgi:hypothetical protein